MITISLIKTSNFYDLLNLTKSGSRPRKERSGVSQSCDVNKNQELLLLPLFSLLITVHER